MSSSYIEMIQNEIRKYSMSDLINGATIALMDCMRYKSNESVLILTDSDHKPMGDIFFQAAQKKVKKLQYKIMTPTGLDGREPIDEEVPLLMKKFDIDLLITRYSLSHTEARREVTKSGVRIASMPGIMPYSLAEGGMTANYKEVLKLTRKMYEEIYLCEKVRVTTPRGTDITMNFGELTWHMDTGILHNHGDFGNLPGGEVDGGPNEGSANGVIVPDYMANLITSKTTLTVKNGQVMKLEAAPKLKKILELCPDNGNIAELGIGTNPNAKDTTSILECEKIFQTVHIGLGNNKFYGGNVGAEFHDDMILERPTLIVDDNKIIENGKWLI